MEKRKTNRVLSGRRPGASHTKQRIIAKAQALFAKKGFNNTTIRQVALEADVDPALVIHYFKNKQQLFAESISELICSRQAKRATTALTTAADPSQVGKNVAQAFIDTLADTETLQLLLGLIRSAASDEQAAQISREFMEEILIAEVEPYIAGPDSRLKASLISSQFIGLITLRYIIKLEPIASATPDQLAAYLAPRIQQGLE